MAKFEVTMNFTYTVQVDADNEEQALEMVQETDIDTDPDYLVVDEDSINVTALEDDSFNEGNEDD